MEFVRRDRLLFVVYLTQTVTEHVDAMAQALFQSFHEREALSVLREPGFVGANDGGQLRFRFVGRQG